MPPEFLRETIRDVRNRTSKPFAVNLIREDTAFGPLTTDDHVAVCIEEAVDLILFFWQLPTASWIDALQRARIPFIVTAGTTDVVELAVNLPLSRF